MPNSVFTQPEENFDKETCKREQPISISRSAKKNNRLIK